MPPPVAVYVVAAVVGVAALFAFKEFVYEPHLAPKLEAWAEGYIQRRRARRNRRASAVPVDSSRPSPDDVHPEHNRPQRAGHGAPVPNDMDGLELGPIVSREVDEWRNEVLRSQERNRDGLRQRKAGRFSDDADGVDGTSTTLDESLASLAHTPRAYAISNMSSPVSSGAASLPEMPSRRPRSESQSTTTQENAGTLLVGPFSPSSSLHAIPAIVQRSPSSNAADGAVHLDIACPSPLAIPNHSPANEVAPHPLPFTPTYQIMVDDCPFGPLLPDTPRSSAEMYGERPFSPITRVMSSSASAASGLRGPLPSRADSVGSSRTLGGSGLLRKGGGLVTGVATRSPDGGDPRGHHAHPSASAPSATSSLSERYPVPPTPPEVVSPPASASSSIGLVSPPSSPGSGGSGVIVHASPCSRAVVVPSLCLPRDSPTASSDASPVLTFASFLSPVPVSRAASGSEADEFMSVGSHESDWGTPADPAPSYNPFMDVVRGDGGSEDGSEESWGSARRH